MSQELIIFLGMIIVFTFSCFKLKLPVSIAMVLSAITGTLMSGNGIPVRKGCLDILILFL